jgi:hypothetical protein
LKDSIIVRQLVSRQNTFEKKIQRKVDLLFKYIYDFGFSLNKSRKLARLSMPTAVKWHKVYKEQQGYLRIKYKDRLVMPAIREQRSLIKQTMEKHNGQVTLKKIRNEIRETSHREIPISTIHYCVRRLLRLSKKKAGYVHPKTHGAQSSSHQVLVAESLCKAIRSQAYIIYIDETSFDRQTGPVRAYS